MNGHALTKQRLNTIIHHPLHTYLGVTDISSEEGRGALDIVARGPLINAAGVLHGGVVYTLCDVCAYAGLLSRLPDDKEAVTHDIRVSVMRAVREGEVVCFRSSLLKMGRSLCFIETTATVNDKPVAKATVTKSLISRPTP